MLNLLRILPSLLRLMIDDFYSQITRKACPKPRKHFIKGKRNYDKPGCGRGNEV